jgi:hypothetical protein
VLDTINIRFDGLDAERHAIEIDALGDSLKGLGRIIGVAATFAVTNKLVLHSDARPLKVVVGPPEPNCLTLQAALSWVDQSEFIAGTASALTASLVTYIITYYAGRKEEMKHLRALAEQALRQAGNRDDAVIQRLLDTVDKMAESLKPAVRKAVKPVGVTARTMTVRGADASAPPLVVDKAMRDVIDTDEPVDIGEEVTIGVRFVEMNLDARTCRIATEDNAETRFAADITDPEMQIPNNAYVTAFAAQTTLAVRAKPTLRDGNVERWYISAHF